MADAHLGDSEPTVRNPPINLTTRCFTGSVALVVGKIEAGLTGEAVEPSSPLATAEVRVRRVPVPA
jgi:hypothetical protein